MPHATTSSTRFQAIILCGPGESLQPFNSKPEEFPKALIPIANRPMIWYPLDWCYRMGITNITLVTPNICSSVLEAALSQNPHLTSLPAPKPTLVAPKELSLTTGTAEIFRIPQVQHVITGDFVVLPCDIVCEMKGFKLLENWLTMQGGISQTGEQHESEGRRGSLGLWYETKDCVSDGGVGVKKEETDFLATVPGLRSIVPSDPGSLRSRIREVVLVMPTATLKDKIEERQGLLLRHAALRRYGRVNMATTSRDAHIYFFPYWVKEFMSRNETFESISEDVLGWWAKAGWQDGLVEKLQLDECLNQRERSGRRINQDIADGFIDTKFLSSTAHSHAQHSFSPSSNIVPPSFATRESTASSSPIRTQPQMPSLIAYLHPAQPKASLLRRVDTVALLLSVSLFLAKLSSLTETGTLQSPFAHEFKIHPSSAPPPELRLTLDQATVLIDANVTLTSKSTIRESVIGAGCILGSSRATTSADTTASEAAKDAPPGVRLQRCVLMEGVVVESGSILNGCVLGRRCKIGKHCDLRDCKVQDGYVVADGMTAKGEVFAGFSEGEGMDSDEVEDMLEHADDTTTDLADQGPPREALD